MAEDLADFLVAIALDLGQRVEVFADALVQLDGRQRAVARDHALQAAQDLAEGQAIGIEQVAVGFDQIEQGADLCKALRIARRGDAFEQRFDVGAALDVLVEQALPDLVGQFPLAGRKRLFVGEEDDDLAIGDSLPPNANQLPDAVEQSLKLGPDFKRLSAGTPG